MNDETKRPEPSQAQIRSFLERDIIVAGEGWDEWCVLSLSGFFRHGRKRVEPVAIHSQLDSHAQAEVARRASIRTMVETGTVNPYGPTYIEDEESFAPVGVLLEKARAAGLEGEAAFEWAEREYAESLRAEGGEA